MAGHRKIPDAKVNARMRRQRAVRRRIKGTTERPRLSVFRSLRFIYAQAIDDSTNRVLASVSDKQLSEDLGDKKKRERAKAVGEAIGKKLLELDVKQVVFDRNGYLYHGRVKEVAEGARAAGLKF
jgi:large subunit ribosomal protein L18